MESPVSAKGGWRCIWIKMITSWRVAVAGLPDEAENEQTQNVKGCPRQEKEQKKKREGVRRDWAARAQIGLEARDRKKKYEKKPS